MIARSVGDEAQPGEANYERRIEAALRFLARASQLDPTHVVDDFRSLQRLLARGAPGAPASLLGAILAALDRAKPTTYEVIARLGASTRLAYLTQGPALGNLRPVVENLLRAGFDAYLDAGGDHACAEILAHCFRAAFPDLRELERIDPAGGAFGIGFVPHPRGLALKSYFNTRIVRDGRHRERVRSIVEHAGCLDADFDRVFGALYDRDRGARFEGIGVDVDEGERVKLYVRMTVPEAFDHARRIADAIGVADPALADVATNFAQAVLARSIELGVGLRGNGGRSLKVTYLFPDRGDEQGILAAARGLLMRCGHEPQILDEVVATLRGEPSHKFPLHGVGLEYPTETPPKVNLYFLP